MSADVLVVEWADAKAERMVVSKVASWAERWASWVDLWVVGKVWKKVVLEAGCLVGMMVDYVVDL